MGRDLSASWASGWDTSGFPADGLPYGVCDVGGDPFVGVPIGDYVLDLAQAEAAGLLPGVASEVVQAGDLNALIALGADALRSLRGRLQALLRLDASPPTRAATEACLVARATVRSRLPIRIGDFTDFYASEHHALRSTRTMIPDAVLAPNWYAMPVSYCSRAGSVVGDGAQVVRPSGQQRVEGVTCFAPTRMLDFEAEIGLVVGAENQRGRPIPVRSAGDHLFGVSLLNDWSARDIQRWESQPLGPHLAKSFATQLGPWVMPVAALRPAATPNPTASAALPHLQHDGQYLFDIEVEVCLTSAAMRREGRAEVKICAANSKDLYWDAAQMIAHVTSNGAPVRIGDLLGTGTISGPCHEQSACLLELTQGGRAPIDLPDGTQRTYLQDDDELTLRGVVRRPDAPDLSLGALRSRVRPAFGLSSGSEGGG